MDARTGGFIDIHQHLVYGLDDGARTFEGSAQMLIASCKEGVGTVFATPHVTPGEVPFAPELYNERLDMIRTFAYRHALNIEILPGAEILYTDATLRFLQQGDIPTLNGGPFILVEFIPDVPWETLFDAVRKLSNAGYVPVIAHIERYACLVKDPGRVLELRGMINLRLQVNCSTILRQRGLKLKRFIKTLLTNRGIDYVATDAHDVKYRPTCMKECYQALIAACPRAYALALTGGNQTEILS